MYKMSNQLELYLECYKDWENEVESSNERDFDFDTLSGESQKNLLFPF